MDNLVWLNEKCLILAKFIKAGMVLGDSPVNPFSGENAVDQVVVAYGRTKGVKGFALLPSVLLNGDVKIIVA